MKRQGKFFIKKKKQKPVMPIVDKGNFPDYMRMEIFTQPQLVNRLLDRYIKADKIDFDYLKIKIDKVKRIYITGNSENYGVVLAGAYNFEVLVDIPCIPILLSEFNFSNPILDKSTLVIVISDSKDNAQCQSAADRISSSGAHLIGIYNYDLESGFAVSLDFVQKSAAATAGYTLRYVALSLLALYFGEKKQVVTELYIKIATKMLYTLGDKIRHILEGEYLIKHMAEKMDGERLLLAGTNVDFAAAVYGAYILSFAFNRDVSAIPVGELSFSKSKWDSIIAFASSECFYDVLIKSVDNCVKIIPQNINSKDTQAIHYDDTIPLLNPILSAVVAQLMAYNIAKQNNVELDNSI